MAALPSTADILDRTPHRVRGRGFAALLDKMCVICREEAFHPVTLPCPCRHVFCWDCIAMALTRSNNCPTCATAILTALAAPALTATMDPAVRPGGALARKAWMAAVAVPAQVPLIAHGVPAHAPVAASNLRTTLLTIMLVLGMASLLLIASLFKRWRARTDAMDKIFLHDIADRVQHLLTPYLRIIYCFLGSQVCLIYLRCCSRMDHLLGDPDLVLPDSATSRFGTSKRSPGYSRLASTSCTVLPARHRHATQSNLDVAHACDDLGRVFDLEHLQRRARHAHTGWCRVGCVHVRFNGQVQGARPGRLLRDARSLHTEGLLAASLREIRRVR